MDPSALTKVGKQLYGDWGWQTKLANALEVNPSTVRRWVAGRTPIPRRTELAICRLIQKKEKEKNE